MSNRDGIYINQVWVCSPDTIATNYVGNDLTKPASLQTSYSSTFKIPDTISVRRLTGNAEQLDSGSSYPYQLIPATVIDGGELVFWGVARLQEFSDGWKATLFEEKRDIFARLDRSIRTADLSAYDHPWTLEQINARTTATYGVCYPAIDYGLLSAGSLPLDNVYPATFASTVVRQMLTEEGYTLTGDLPNDPLFKAMVIPFTEQEGTNHDQKWIDDRKARVTQDNGEYATNRSAFDSGHVIDRIQPFNIDNRPAETWSQGLLKNFNTTMHEYVCDTSMRVRIDALQTFKVRNTSGSVEFILIVEKNGQNVHQEYFASPGPYNLLYSRNDKLEIHKTIPCQKGDRLAIRFIVQRRTTLSAFSVTIYNDPASSWVAFTPDSSLHTGDVWPIARNLPNMTGVSLLIDLAYIFGGSWVPDPRRREIKFVSLTGTIENIANAVDWSARLDTDPSRPPGWVPALSPYSQANYLKWKETEETKATDGELNYGDGVINVSGDTLDTKIDLFELSFAASTLSTNEIAGYGQPILIKTRTVSGTGDSLSINKQNAAPRLALVTLGSEIVEVPSKRLASDGVTQEDVIVKLRSCWFGPRPNVAINANTGFCLAFSPVKNLKGEVVLIARNYAGLMRVLIRPRVFTTSIRLYPEDIANLDFNRPIRLKRVTLGSLVLSDGFYYLNTINNYRSNSPCSATLIAF